jgi:alpha-amylase/alpha-mannosidase (GH57 family)
MEAMDLAILWHFHQPLYHKPKSRYYMLPWVNYHTTKNYYQMARLAEESGFPCACNFVPCLLEQIADYACGRASDPYQRALEKHPDQLESFELELLKNFVPDEHDPAALQWKALRSFFSPVEEIPGDKQELFHLQKEIFQNLFLLYSRLAQGVGLELTTSPYYHPLLPLIFDLDVAGDGQRPPVSFRHPEDGEQQIQTGREYFKKTFGFYPQGMWPSEGGISRSVARAIAAAGFSFAVTDENVLWKSLNKPIDRKNLYRPYVSEGLAVFFRDRELSDLIGFEYHKWDERDAVQDFIRRIKERKKVCDDHSILVIALDGENPWGSYRQNGVPFLREFFLRLKEQKDIHPTLFRDHLARHKPSREVSLVPGTWQGNFSKWVGTPAKNEGWVELGKARDACGPSQEILVAEGSDWFWWFGEEATAEFRYLFKSYIEEAYRQTGKKP